MPELAGRWVDNEDARQPTPNTYTTYFTVGTGEHLVYGMDVCNGEAEDAHISILVIPSSKPWVDGNPSPPTLAFVVKKVRIESDGTDGNVWVMPVKHLVPGDRVVVWTDKPGVTFYGHGYKLTS